jgi:hypothetical protein
VWVIVTISHSFRDVTIVVPCNANSDTKVCFLFFPACINCFPQLAKEIAYRQGGVENCYINFKLGQEKPYQIFIRIRNTKDSLAIAQVLISAFNHNKRDYSCQKLRDRQFQIDSPQFRVGITGLPSSITYAEAHHQLEKYGEILRLRLFPGSFIAETSMLGSLFLSSEGINSGTRSAIVEYLYAHSAAQAVQKNVDLSNVSTVLLPVERIEIPQYELDPLIYPTFEKSASKEISSHLTHTNHFSTCIPRRTAKNDFIQYSGRISQNV